MQGDGDTVTICDLATHPQAIRIRLPDTSLLEQYFFVEHHRQSESNFITTLPPDSLPWHNPEDVMTYDIIDDSVSGPGMFILYDDDRILNQPPHSLPTVGDEGSFRVMVADGRWHWVADGWVTAPWSQTQQLRLYRRGAAARSPSGALQDTNVYEFWNTYKTDRQKLDLGIQVPHPSVPTDSIHIFDYMWSWKDNAGPGDFVNDLDTVNLGKSRRSGDGGDAWSLSRNTMFSPWSNPNTDALAGGPSGIAVQLLDQTDTTSTVKVWLSGSLNGPPSRPQHLLVHLDSLSRPALTWETNPEPDVDSAGTYIIQRCDGFCDLDTNWYAQDTVDGDIALWHDTLTVDLLNYTHRYRIKATDTQNLESVWSEDFYLHGGGDTKQDPDPPSAKAVTGTTRHAATGVHIRIEPNPVTTACRLEWSLPEDGAVSIRLFDMKGRQVAWPVNTFSTAGRHNTMVNIENLPSGGYLCMLMYQSQVWSTTITVR